MQIKIRNAMSVCISANINLSKKGVNMKPKYQIEVENGDKELFGKKFWWYRIIRRSNGKILVMSETFTSKAHTVKMARMFEQDLKGSKVVIK